MHAVLLASVAQAARTGDLEALTALLTDEATFTSDGGGKVTAATRVLEGAERVAKFLIGVLRKGDAAMTYHPAVFNGHPGLRLELDGRVFAVTVFSISDGQISAIHQVLNPEKLAHLQNPREPAAMW